MADSISGLDINLGQAAFTVEVEKWVQFGMQHQKKVLTDNHKQLLVKLSRRTRKDIYPAKDMREPHVDLEEVKINELVARGKGCLIPYTRLMYLLKG